MIAKSSSIPKEVGKQEQRNTDQKPTCAIISEAPSLPGFLLQGANKIFKSSSNSVLE